MREIPAASPGRLRDNGARNPSLGASLSRTVLRPATGKHLCDTEDEYATRRRTMRPGDPLRDREIPDATRENNYATRKTSTRQGIPVRDAENKYETFWNYYATNKTSTRRGKSATRHGILLCDAENKSATRRMNTRHGSFPLAPENSYATRKITMRQGNEVRDTEVFPQGISSSPRGFKLRWAAGGLLPPRLTSPPDLHGPVQETGLLERVKGDEAPGHRPQLRGGEIFDALTDCLRDRAEAVSEHPQERLLLLSSLLLQELLCLPFGFPAALLPHLSFPLFGRALWHSLD